MRDDESCFHMINWVHFDLQLVTTRYTQTHTMEQDRYEGPIKSCVNSALMAILAFSENCAHHTRVASSLYPLDVQQCTLRYLRKVGNFLQRDPLGAFPSHCTVVPIWSHGIRTSWIALVLELVRGWNMVAKSVMILFKLIKGLVRMQNLLKWVHHQRVRYVSYGHQRWDDTPEVACGDGVRKYGRAAGQTGSGFHSREANERTCVHHQRLQMGTTEAVSCVSHCKRVALNCLNQPILATTLWKP